MYHRPDVSPAVQIIIEQFRVDFDVDVSILDFIGEHATYRIRFVGGAIVVLTHEQTGEEYWYTEQYDRTWALTKVWSSLL